MILDAWGTIFSILKMSKSVYDFTVSPQSEWSCVWSSQDELARVLVTLFDSRHLLYQLLWNMFSKEVELADSMQTLFRGNSLASKIMTFCFKVPLRFPWRALKSNDHSKRQMIQIKLSCEFPSWNSWKLSFSGIWGHVSAEVAGAVAQGSDHGHWVADAELWGGSHQVSVQWTFESVICSWCVGANSPVTW